MESYLFNRYKVSFWEDKKVLELDGGDICTTMKMYLMSLNCISKMG